MRHHQFCLILPAVLVVAASAAAPDKIADYASLMDALTDGATVRVVVDYGRCRLVIDGEEKDAPDAIGGMTVEVWESFAAGSVGNEQAFVVFSHASLIAHPRRGVVLNHVKFKISEDDQVVITARYLEPDTYEEVMFEEFFTSITRGSDGAAAFYRLD